MKIPSDDIKNSLLPKYISGDITGAERIVVENWVAASQENEKIFLEYKRIWDYAENSIAKDLHLPVIDLDNEWKHQLSLIEKEKTRSKVVEMMPSTERSWYQVAASISIIFIVAFSIYYFTGGFGTSYEAVAENKEVAFKDGTIVTLHEGSEISYRRSYNKKSRVVNFEGEAFFQVTPDIDKPFIIQTQEARIRVVGTSFNVRAIPDEETVEVTVTSGEVMLLNTNGDQAVALKVNEKGTFNRKTGVISRIENDNMNFLSWKTRVLQFENTNLADVVKTLNRVFPEKKIMLKTTDTGSCSITVTFDSQTIEAIMNVLESTLDLELQTDGEVIDITGAGC